MCSTVLVCMFILGTSGKGPKSKSKVSSLGQIRWFNYCSYISDYGKKDSVHFVHKVDEANSVSFLNWTLIL